MEHFNLIGFSLLGLVTMITPGPNNFILFSYGKFYGFKGAYKTMSGIFLGFMSVLFLTGYGVAELMSSNEKLAFGMKIASSLWFLYLAFTLSRMEITAPKNLQQRVGFVPMYLLQFMNPKAWVLAIAAASAFMPTYANVHVNIGIYALGLPILGIPCMITWLSLGDVFSKFSNTPQANKIAGYTLGGLLLVSVGLIWI